LAWTFSPDGGVVLGEEGPVTHLGCEDDAVYDWSTGLIFKNGRYFDPELGIWLLGPLMVVFGLWRPRRRRKGRKGTQRNHFFTLLIVLLVMVMPLTGCDPPEPELPPTPTCTPTPVPGQPSATPSPSVPTKDPTSIPESPDTPIPPTGTPPSTETPTTEPTPTPTRSVNDLKFANPFGTGKRYLINGYYGKHTNKDGNPIGYQTDLGGGQGTGHPGIDLVPLNYALESKRNGYTPSLNHRELYSPLSGVLKKEPNKHRVSITVNVLEGVATVGLVHVDSNEGLPDNTLVQAGQPLLMSFKGQGYGTGSDYPHLHLEVYTGNTNNKVYVNPLSMLPENDSEGNYWNYVDPSDGKYFTQLPGLGD
jgi:hypothetical protein